MLYLIVFKFCPFWIVCSGILKLYETETETVERQLRSESSYHGKGKRGKFNFEILHSNGQECIENIFNIDKEDPSQHS